MDTELKVGDFVYFTESPNLKRIIVSIDPKGGPGSGQLFGVNLDISGVFRENWAHYTKEVPTLEQIQQAKKRLNKEFNQKNIDNLTFIEISARLREYEQQI